MILTVKLSMRRSQNRPPRTGQCNRTPRGWQQRISSTWMATTGKRKKTSQTILPCLFQGEESSTRNAPFALKRESAWLAKKQERNRGMEAEEWRNKIQGEHENKQRKQTTNTKEAGDLEASGAGAQVGRLRIFLRRFAAFEARCETFFCGFFLFREVFPRAWFSISEIDRCLPESAPEGFFPRH